MDWLAKFLVNLLLKDALSPEKLEEYASYLKRLGYRLVDAGLAYALAMIRKLIDSYQNGVDIVLAASSGIGSDNLDPTTNLAGSFIFMTLLRYVGPILLQYLGKWIFPAIGLFVMASIPANATATEIVGPTSVADGKPPIVRVSAKIEEGSRCIWLAFPMEGIDIEANGSDCQLVGLPGKSHSLILVELRKEGANPPQSQVQSTVLFGGTAPPLPPDIPPNPPPAPSKYGLDTWAKAAAYSLMGRDKIAAKVRDLVKEMEGGSMNPEGFMKGLRDYLDSAEFSQWSGGWDKFRAGLKAKLVELQFGKAAIAEWIIAGKELASGLGG